jgi:hypothetical protein
MPHGVIPKKSNNIKPRKGHIETVLNLAKGNCTLSKAIQKAGYSRKTARKPQNITDSKGFKMVAKPFIEQLETEIQRALSQLEHKIDDATYSDCRTTVKDFTHIKQLLGGGATERTEISWLE